MTGGRTAALLFQVNQILLVVVAEGSSLEAPADITAYR